jgi:hypothetical protein
MEGKRESMKNFAVIDENNLVVNVIVADSKEVAESVTGLTCIEDSELLGSIGLVYNDGIFAAPLPEPRPITDTVQP